MNANELTTVSVGFEYIDMPMHICGCIHELACLLFYLIFISIIIFSEYCIDLKPKKFAITKKQFVGKGCLSF